MNIDRKVVEQEPVATVLELYEAKRHHLVYELGFDWKAPLYTSPQASKPWVGLTDEERRSLREWQEIQKELGPVWAPMMLYLYEAIEAKLKEKNT